MRSSTRTLTLAAAGAALVLLAVFAVPLLGGGVHTMHDMGEWYVPMRAFYAECLAQGDRSDWIPGVFGGYYLQGDGQVGMYHPLHRLWYSWLPLTTAVAVEMLFGFVAMLLGTVVLLRKRWKLSLGAAWFGGLVVAFSGYNLRHFEHMNAMQILGHVPWMFVLIDIALRHRDVRTAQRAAVGVGLLTVSELLIGYPQYFWFSSFAECAYVLAVVLGTAAWRRRGCLYRLAWLGGAKALGVLGGAIQLLPTADLLSTSVRQNMSIADRSQWPWHPFELTTLVAPYATDQKTLAIFYPGVVSVALVTWLLVRGRSDRRRAAMCGALAAVGLCVWLALGQFGLLYRLHLELPVIGVFRMPYRYLSIASLGVGLLAALAVHRLARRRSDCRPDHRPFLFALPILGVLCLGAVAALDATDGSFYIERHGPAYPLAIAGLLALTAAAWLIHRAERGVRWALPALALLAAVDLGVHGFRFVYRGGLPVTLDEYRAAIPEPPDRDGRALSPLANQNLLRDWHTTGGYMPLLPDAPLLQEIDEFGERSVPHLRVAGVRWIQEEEVGDRWTQRAWSIEALRDIDGPWRPVPDPLARARLVDEVLLADDAADAVAKTGQVDVARVAVVETDLPIRPGPTVGTARIVEDRPGEITVDVEATAAQLLVVNERMRPGWVVRVGHGAPVAPVRAYGTFLSCLVTPDTRRVTFRFEPESLTRGLRYSMIGGGALVFLLALLWIYPRRAG